MPIINGVIASPGGPLIDLWICVSRQRASALRNAGLQPPDPVQVRALIDTGASLTCVDSRVIAQLRIPATGTITGHTPSTGGTPATFSQYDVALVIDNPKIHVVKFTLPVAESNLHQQQIGALIGRDILDSTTLFYNGTSGTFSWSAH